MEETHGKGKAEAQEPTIVAYLTSLDPFRCDQCSELFGGRVYTCENDHMMCGRCNDNNKGMCGKSDGAIGTKSYPPTEKAVAQEPTYVGKGKAEAEEPTIVAYLTSLEPITCHHCSELFGKHVYWCKNFHLMCRRCHDSQKGMCGKCDGAIGTKRHPRMEKYVAVTRIDCGYKKYGCNKSRLTLLEKQRHEYGCSYAPHPARRAPESE